jgi:cyclase
MIKKRIIPKLVLSKSFKTGKVISGSTVEFEKFRIVGSPESQSEIFQSSISDELMVVCRRSEVLDFQEILQTLGAINNKILMPLSFGGSIESIEQVSELFDLGIEKIIFGRSIFRNPTLVVETASRYGSQAVVASIDYWGDLKTTGVGEAKLDSEIKDISSLSAALVTALELGAGEICLTDVSRDGKMLGTNIEVLKKSRNLTSLPIIQNCGVGRTSNFVDAFKGGADAIAVGTYFAFQDQNFIEIRSHISNSGIDIRTR